MKKILFILMALLTFIFPVKSQSQTSYVKDPETSEALRALAIYVEPDIERFFPNMTWKDYVCQKAVVLALTYYDMQIPDVLDDLDESDEEDDSLFIAQINGYFESKDNKVICEGWIKDYMQDKYPALFIKLDKDNYYGLMIDSFLDYLSPKNKKDLEAMKDKQDKWQNKKPDINK